MPTYYMAIDLGASSGRNILGWIENGKIRLREVHRFVNESREVDGILQWDVTRLFKEIVTGLKKAGDIGMAPESIGVDTWGVDFVLLDRNDNLLGPAVSYRDTRTKGMDARVAEVISDTDLYARTGIQGLVFNTIYQLTALRTGQPKILDDARTFLMMPDYLNYLLTGEKTNEYTEASTSQLLEAESGQWDRGLLAMLDIPERIFQTLRTPGALVGSLRPDIRREVGFDCQVVLPPTHDTASAVLAMPATDDNGIYLSSGTWSLMGIEITKPDCRDLCRQLGFTNEGGYDRRYTFLKNIMGLWIIQSLRKELVPDGGFGEMISLAKSGMEYDAVIDVNALELLAPDSMKQAIRECCAKSGCPAPESDAHVVACAYNSLAHGYAEAVREVESLAGRGFGRVNILGGGSQDDFLNRLTAEKTGKDIYAGPVEATALGNVLSQMLRREVFTDINQARRAVADSFEVKRV